MWFFFLVLANYFKGKKGKNGKRLIRARDRSVNNSAAVSLQ